MFLNLQIHKYDRDIYPFIKNGIIIDTSVFWILAEGIVITRISKQKSPELDEILLFLDNIKMNNKWSKFFITPHILTEICNHLRNTYSKWENYREIIKEIIPMIAEMEDKTVTKDKILGFINFENPVVEVGDISIFVTADDFLSRHIKVAILANDRELNKRYEDSRNVMLLDYKSNTLNSF